MTILLFLVSPTQGFANSGSQADVPESIPPAWTWQDPITVDDASFFQNMTDRSMRYMRDGTPCIAYGAEALYYSCYDFATEEWNTEIVDDDVRVGEHAALDFNNFDDPFISYYDAYDGELRLAYNSGGVWYIRRPFKNPSFSCDPPPSEVFEEIIDPLLGLTAEQLETRRRAKQKLWDLITLRPWRDELLRSPSNSESLTVSPDPEGAGLYTSIDVDDNNRIHVSFYIANYYDDYEKDRSLNYYTWDGVNPEECMIVDNYHDQGRTGLYSSIAVRYHPDIAKYSIHIAYFNEKYDQVRYARKKINDTFFEKYDVEDRLSYTGPFVSIALNDDGVPHLSYFEWTEPDREHGKLRFAKITNVDNPNTMTVDSEGEVGLWTSIALKYDDDDEVDKVYISYYDAENGDLKYADATNPDSGGDWDTHVLHNGDDEDDHVDAGLWTSIDLNEGGYPGISYYNLTDGLLQFMYWDSVAKKWVLSDVNENATADLGLSTSLVIAETNIPHISYFEDIQDNLKHAYLLRNPLSIDPPDDTYLIYTSILSKTMQAGSFSSIGLINNSPEIAYYEMEENDLEMARIGPTGWEFEEIQKSNDVGQYVSMAIDSNEIPHISFYDADRGDLMYATWDVFASEWMTLTLDQDGDVGKFSSIGLDTTDHAYVSYFDVYDNELKFTYQAGPFYVWQAPVVVDTDIGDLDLWVPDEVIASTSIAVDGNDNPHIIYYDAYQFPPTGESKIYGQLKYARGDNSGSGVSWPEVGTIVDGSMEDMGRWNDLVWDPDGFLHACYYQEFVNNPVDGNLKYATKPASGPFNWTIQADPDTATDGDIGMFCSIALNDNNEPAISYYDASRGALKLVTSFDIKMAELIFLPFLSNNLTP